MIQSAQRTSSACLLLLLLSVCPLSTAWSAQGDLLWQNRLDVANGFDDASSTAASDGRLFVAGSVTNAAGNTDWLVRALDPKTGALLWQDKLDLANRSDSAQSVVTEDGQVFVSGYVTPAKGARDVLVRAYDAKSGRLRWQNQFDRGLGRTDTTDFYNLAVKDSRLVVGGLTFNANGNADWLIRAFDAQTGKLLWQDFADGGNFDHNVSVVIDHGRVYASGVTTDTNIVRHFTVRTYDVDTGALLWQDRIPQGNAGFFFTTDVAWQLAAHGKRVVAVGSIGDGNDNTRFVVRAYQSETGSLLWADSLESGSGADVALSVALSEENVFVVGSGGSECSAVEASNCNWLIRAYDPDDGTLRWKKEVDWKGGDDQPSIILAVDDQVVVAGEGETGFGQGSSDWVVQAYSARNGALKWSDAVEEPEGAALPLSLSSRKGSLFVGGWVFDDVGNGDAIVRAYDLGGKRNGD